MGAKDGRPHEPKHRKTFSVWAVVAEGDMKQGGIHSGAGVMAKAFGGVSWTGFRGRDVRGLVERKQRGNRGTWCEQDCEQDCEEGPV